jgi:AcrR family transcriptional regulator
MLVVNGTAQARRRPSQARARATVDVILEAAEQVLLRGGTSAFNTNCVAERAGVSVGSVYQYFHDKGELLAEVKLRKRQAIVRSAKVAYDSFPSTPMSDIMRTIVRTIISAHVNEPDLHKILEDEVIILPELGYHDVLQLEGLKDFRGFLERYRDEIIVRDLDLATFIVTRTFRSVVSAALKACPEKLASGVIEDELTGFAMRYLTGKS